MTHQANNSLANKFRVLTDKNRLKILLFIHQRACQCPDNDSSGQRKTCLKDLAQHLSVTVPTISHHIKELVNANLITANRDGRCVYCEINRKEFQTVNDFLNIFIN